MAPGGMYEIISRKRDGLELDREEIDYVVSGSARGTSRIIKSRPG